MSLNARNRLLPVAELAVVVCLCIRVLESRVYRVRGTVTDMRIVRMVRTSHRHVTRLRMPPALVAAILSVAIIGVFRAVGLAVSFQLSFFFVLLLKCVY